jgi:hypothetical protein
MGILKLKDCELRYLASKAGGRGNIYVNKASKLLNNIQKLPSKRDLTENGDQPKKFTQSSIWNGNICWAGFGPFCGSTGVWAITVPDGSPTGRRHIREFVSYIDGIYSARMWNGKGNIEL